MKICNFGGAELASTRPILARVDQSRQDLRAISGSDASAPCPKCNSTEIDLEPMGGNSPHYAKRVCACCNRFLGWAPKPESQQKRQQMQTTINQLLQSPQLSPWECEFLENMRERRALSPKHQEILSRIEVKVGGQG